MFAGVMSVSTAVSPEGWILRYIRIYLSYITDQYTVEVQYSSMSSTHAHTICQSNNTYLKRATFQFTFRKGSGGVRLVYERVCPVYDARIQLRRYLVWLAVSVSSRYRRVEPYI